MRLASAACEECLLLYRPCRGPGSAGGGAGAKRRWRAFGAVLALGAAAVAGPLAYLAALYDFDDAQHFGQALMRCVAALC